MLFRLVLTAAMAALFLPIPCAMSQEAGPQETDPAAALLAAPESVAFELFPEDILSWEQTGGGKYIYLDIVPEKAKEFEAITRYHAGRDLDIVYSSAVIHAGPIQGPMKIDTGFVLVPKEEQRPQLLQMMDPAKEKNIKNAADLPVAPAEVQEKTE